MHLFDKFEIIIDSDFIEEVFPSSPFNLKKDLKVLNNNQIDYI